MARLFCQRMAWAAAVAVTSALVLLLGRAAPASGNSASPLQAGAALYPAFSDRFGVGVNRQLGTVEQYDVAPLRAGWYVDWGVQLDPAYPAGLHYLQTVHTSGDAFSPDEATLAAVVAANPGASWVVGNEPDCIYQGNSTPDQYARLYRRVYEFLKARDPRCRVSIGGIVQATPLRLQWLDAVLAAYRARYGVPLPADFWNIHAFVLREERFSWGCDIPPGLTASRGELWQVDDHDRVDLVAQQILRFRRWMRDHGERDKELIVSEYGILMPDDLGFDEARVQAFMRATFDYFRAATDAQLGCPADGNRLVQRWAWYSLNDRQFEGHTSRSHLYEPTSGEMTALGHDYAAYVGPLYSPYVDLTPVSMRFSVSRAAAPAGNAGLAEPALPTEDMGLARYVGPADDGAPARTVTIAVIVRNAGNVDVHNASVQLWLGDPSHPLGDRYGMASLAARSRVSLSFQWRDVPPGRYAVGVTADGEGQIAESDEGNNVLVQDLLVPRHELYLPILGQRP